MSTPRPSFPFPNNPQDTSYTILLEWWAALEADKGNRAELKRAEHALGIAFSPAYHNLLRRLQEAGYRLGPDSRERLAVLAGLAVHVKWHTENGRSVAAQMGSPKPGADLPSLWALCYPNCVCFLYSLRALHINIQEDHLIFHRFLYVSYWIWVNNLSI